jgi:hypothetical protein
MLRLPIVALDRADIASDFLKERLFGLSNPQGNHGESLKEAHFHLDNTPTVCALLDLQYTANIMPALVHEVPLQVAPAQIPI